MSYGGRFFNSNGTQIGADYSYGLFAVDSFVLSGTSTIQKTYDTSVYSGITAIHQGGSGNVTVSGNTVTASPTNAITLSGSSLSAMEGRVVVFASQKTSPSGYGFQVNNPNGKLVIDNQYRGLSYFGSVLVPAAPAYYTSYMNLSVSVSMSGVPNQPFILWEVPQSPRTLGGTSWQIGARLDSIVYSAGTATLKFTRGPSTPSFRAHLFCDYIPPSGSHGLRVWGENGIEIFNSSTIPLRVMSQPPILTTPSISYLGRAYGNREAWRAYISSYPGFSPSGLLSSAYGLICGDMYAVEDSRPKECDFTGVMYVTPSGSVELGWSFTWCWNYSGGASMTNMQTGSYDILGPTYATDADNLAFWLFQRTQPVVFVNKGDIGITA